MFQPIRNHIRRSRHSGRDCRNPGYRDVFKITVHGSGYPLPGGYDVHFGLAEASC